MYFCFDHHHSIVIYEYFFDLQDWTDGNDEQILVSFILSKTLEHKLSLIFGKNLTTESQNERLLLKRKRKESADNNNSNGNNKGKESLNISKKVVVPKGIVEDIFADVGKYVPVGSLDEKELEECSLKKMEEERSKMDVVIPSNASAKGLFQNLLPSFPITIKIKNPTTETVEPNKSIIAPILSNNDDNANPGINTACLFDDEDEDEDELEKVIQINSNKITSSKTKTKIFQSDIKSEKRNKDNINEKKNENENDDDGDNRNISRTDGDLMAPIRALLAAQQNKEKAAYERSEAAATASSGADVILFYLIFISIFIYLELLISWRISCSAISKMKWSS